MWRYVVLYKKKRVTNDKYNIRNINLLVYYLPPCTVILAALLLTRPNEVDAIHVYIPESVIEAKFMVSDGLSMSIPLVPARPFSNLDKIPFESLCQYTVVI